MARTRKQPLKKVKKVSLPKKRGILRRVFGPIGRFIKRIARPFRFVLRPFKTKPFRFIGRVLSKILFLSYFRESWRELRQVTWPNRKETIQLTFAVFIFAVTFALFIGVIDFGLDKLFREVLL